MTNRSSLAYSVGDLAAVIVIAYVAVFVASNTFAATYFVLPSGKDSNVGSQKSPWKTIQHATDKVYPGDTVFVGGGTYSGKVNFTQNGTSNRPITFRNIDGQTPILDGGSTVINGYDSLVWFKNVSHIKFSGFEIKNSSSYNLYVGGESHHLEISDNNIYGAGASNVFIEGPNSQPAFSKFINNKVHNAYQGGITLWYSLGGYYTFENNEVYGNVGNSNYDGLQIGGGASSDKGLHHIVVRNNHIYDNGKAEQGEDNLDLGGHFLNHHYLVEFNDVHGNIGSFKLNSGDILIPGSLKAGVSGHHIARFNKFTGIGWNGYNQPNPIVFYNNTFVDSGTWLQFYSDGSPGKPSFGNSTYIFDSDTGRMNWKNNLFWQEKSALDAYGILTAGTPPVDMSYSSVKLQNNMYRFNGQRIGVSKNSIYSAVKPADFETYQTWNEPNKQDIDSNSTIVNSSSMFANISSRNFELVKGAPAIDKGIALTKATNSGINSILLKVDRASYFQDGYCVKHECLSMPDSIVIGNNTPIDIVSINDLDNTIILASPATWQPGTAVTLPYFGSAPDIGVYEYSPISSQSRTLKRASPAKPK